MRRACIPHATRIESAARIAAAYLPVSDDAAARPNPIAFIAALALAFFAGFCAAAAGVPLPW